MNTGEVAEVERAPDIGSPERRVAAMTEHWRAFQEKRSRYLHLCFRLGTLADKALHASFVDEIGVSGALPEVGGEVTLQHDDYTVSVSRYADRDDDSIVWYLGERPEPFQKEANFSPTEQV